MKIDEYKIDVIFDDKDIRTNLRKLVQNDYNSTKLNFTFDRTADRVLFKLIAPSGEIALISEIVDNSLLLGPGVLAEEGEYTYEISLYDDNSKLTNYAVQKFYVRSELTNCDDEIQADNRFTVLDSLINEVNETNQFLKETEEHIKNGDYYAFITFEVNENMELEMNAMNDLLAFELNKNGELEVEING